MLSKYQIELMKHTISDHDRNWFGTSDNTRDYNEFINLVSLGFARKIPAPSFWGDDVVFILTDEGKQALRMQTNGEVGG